MAIITGKQAQKAAKDIVKKTGWSFSRAAKRLGWPCETFRKIYHGYTINPSEERMDQLGELLESVEQEIK